MCWRLMTYLNCCIFTTYEYCYNLITHPILINSLYSNGNIICLNFYDDVYCDDYDDLFLYSNDYRLDAILNLTFILFKSVSISFYDDYAFILYKNALFSCYDCYIFLSHAFYAKIYSYSEYIFILMDS